MLAELERISEQKIDDAAYLKLKRWKFANAFKKDAPLELIDYASQLACCGDWCISGRIESAFMSSVTLAQKLKDVIV
jgi:predicted NAD/FAD-dependent oxidoreductase